MKTSDFDRLVDYAGKAGHFGTYAFDSITFFRDDSVAFWAKMAAREAARVLALREVLCKVS